MLEVTGGKVIRSFDRRKPEPGQPVTPSARPTLKAAAIIPQACGSGWGDRIWRDAQGEDDIERVANVSYWDLCEIGYKLALGFLRYTDYGYQAFSTAMSWVAERPWYMADGGDPQQHDTHLQRDLVALADILHVNEYHNHGLLAGLQPGKRMVIHHHGCAYRDNPGKYERAEVEAGYTRLVSTPDLLACGDPKYRKKLKWLPSPLSLEELDRNFPRWTEREGDKPVVVAHAYTVGNNKRTEEFLRIAEAVAWKTPLQVGLINRVQRRQALWYISQCDVYFATFLYGPGLASYEAMAFGKPVLVGCTADELAAQREVIGRELPFIHVTPQTCGKWLRDLVADPGLRHEWGERGRRYIEKFHDLPQVVKRLKKLYEQTKPCKAMVQP